MRYPRLHLSVLALLLALAAAPHATQAQVPDSISYQGHLADDSGQPVDGTVNLHFYLYDQPTGGTALWDETQTGVPVDNGTFSVYLGANTSLSNVAFDEPLYLGISVEGGNELTPRTPLVPAPYALGLRGLRVEPTSSDEGPNVIGGWSGNSVTSGAQGATISGGGDPDFLGSARPNQVTADYGTVGGGASNTASDNHATVGGGYSNTAHGPGATVGGGELNIASGSNAIVGGGVLNTASGNGATVGGGDQNTASGYRATVGGGDRNTASGYRATVGGGASNTASGGQAIVGGGYSNTASGSFATVGGGERSEARGDYSFAAGYKARAIHEGSFAWSDRSITSGDDSLLTTGANQFLIRAAGGVGIGTDAPQTRFDVEREVSGGATAANHVAFIENTATSNGDVLALRSNATDPGDPVNFITFKSAGDNIGAIEGNGSGGINLDTDGGDFAEWLPRQRPSEEIEAGEVVGLFGGQVAKATAGAGQVSVVTDRAAVVGNSPGEEERAGYEKVSFVGQVPVKTRGTVAKGDLLVASGQDDGTARAVAPSDYDPAADGPVVGQAWEASPGGTRRVNAVIGHAGETAALRGVAQRQQKQIEQQKQKTAALEARLEKLEQDRAVPLNAGSMPAATWLLGGLVLVGGLFFWRRRDEQERKEQKRGENERQR